MIIIADSSSTRTEWTLLDGDVIVAHALTQGLNPFYLSRREISHIIRLGLPDVFFKRRWEQIFFYGAGCANPERNKIVELSLNAQFRTPVTINSDLLGSARGLFGTESGMACILGSGSNSCLFDGESIVANVRSGGFILGDEGSGGTLGRQFASDCLKGIAPKDLVEEFFDEYKLSKDSMVDAVYTFPHVNRTLSTYAVFLAKHLRHPYVVTTVREEFSKFFRRNVLLYPSHKDVNTGFVGSIAVTFENILREVGDSYGINISKISSSSMDGLVLHHASR